MILDVPTSSNASTEGFNNKIRWLIKHAYGFRDHEYLKLKIFQLPEISCVKEIQFMEIPVEEAKNGMVEG